MIIMVLGATAVPIELRAPNLVAVDYGIYIWDFLANVAGYIPMGIVLGDLGPILAFVAAVGMSALAETGQFVMMHRDPSVVDVVANAFGAALGILVRQAWNLRSPGFTISRRRGLAAAIFAFSLVARAWATSGYALSARGFTSPGRLEAYWKFDERAGEVALDASGQGLLGRFNGSPARVAGMLGSAVWLDGRNDYIDFGRSTALRLVGSMTISAWINSSSFPVDDAAIVSSHNGLGFQLDTTVDRGPRAIGFKLAGACGHLMARYGATPLSANRWYYVSGVYDAEAQSLSVYVNGKLDNGFLLGPVTRMQRSSREAVYVGRRSNHKGYEFAGFIDDVRIYSRPLTEAEISADMHGSGIDKPLSATGREIESRRRRTAREEAAPPCGAQSDIEDAILPGMAVVLGVLVAVVCVSFRPSGGPAYCLISSLAAGTVLVVITVSNMPWLGRCLIPLTSLAGGASIVAGRSRQIPRG